MNQNEEALRTLMNRLYWPTPAVGCSSCLALAELLADATTRDSTAEFLVKWLSLQQTEYREALAVLPIVYAALALHVDRSTLPTAGVLVSRMPRASFLSKRYLKALGAPDWLLETSECGFLEEDQKPLFSESEFSDLMMQSGVAPVIPHRMKELSLLTAKDCMRHMFHEWRYLSKQVTDEFVDPDPDMGSEYIHSYIPTTYRSTDLYLSAYLRTLAWLSDAGALSEDKAESHAAIVSPVVLGFWQVAPNRSPEWWPECSQSDDLSPSRVEDALRVVCQGTHGLAGSWPILRASGRVACGTCPIDLDVVAYFAAGSDPSSPEETREAFDQAQHTRYLDAEGLDLPSVIKETGYRESASREDSGTLAGASAWVPIESLSLWHWMLMSRASHGFWIPARWFAGGSLSVQAGESGILFRRGDEVIASWTAWNSGASDACPYLSGRSEHDKGYVEPSNGIALSATSSAVGDVERQTGTHMHWVCRARTYPLDQNGFEHGIVDSFVLVR